MPERPQAARWAPALALVVAWTALRLWYAGRIELAEDEAYYWVWSRTLAAGYFDHPPAVAWMIRAGTALLGDTERGVRLGALLLGGLSVGFAAAMVEDRLRAATVLVGVPLFCLGGLLATPDAPLIAAWTAGMLAWTRGSWATVGLCCGLAMLSKYTGVLLLPLLILAEPGALRGRGPYLAALIALLTYSPNVAWNLGHDLISWRFQLEHVASSADGLGFALAQLGLASPLLALGFLAWWAVGWRGDRVERMCWWTSLPVLAIAVWAGGEANWAAPAMIGPAVALSRRGGAWARLSWIGAGVGLAMSAVALIHFQTPLLDLPNDPRDRVTGGRVLGESVRAWDIPNVYTSRYQEAALIAFYGGVHAVALPQAGRPDQYDLWAEPLADHALFVRPWRASTSMAMLDLGYDTDGPNTVSAYLMAPDGLTPRLAARWQVYEVWRTKGTTGDSPGL